MEKSPTAGGRHMACQILLCRPPALPSLCASDGFQWESGSLTFSFSCICVHIANAMSSIHWTWEWKRWLNPLGC